MHEQSMATDGESAREAGTEMKEVMFDLTEAEFAAKGKEAAELRVQATKLELEFEDIKSSFKSRIQLKEQELSSVLTIIKSGKEMREVECTVKHDYGRGVVEYWHGGSLKAERPMDHNERQGRLPV